MVAWSTVFLLLLVWFGLFVLLDVVVRLKYFEGRTITRQLIKYGS